MKQKSVGMTLRALIIALVLSLVAGSPALPPFDGVAYAQSTGLIATVAPGGGSVNLTWTAVAGADSYEVWRGDGAGSTVQWGSSALATVTAPAVTYTDSAVTAGNTYSYAVRAVTGGTPASFAGPYPRVDIPGGTAKPTARPTVTVAADGNTAVDVSWTAVAGATSYEIEFWHAGLDDWDDSIAAQTSRSYNHTGLTPGTEYYYVVRGVNAGGMGPWSSWRTDDSKITLQGTTAVPELTATAVNRTTVRLTWTPTTGAASYDLQRRKATTAAGGTVTPGTWARLPSALLSGSTTTYTDSAAIFDAGSTGDNSATTYYYRVQAIDGNGNAGTWSKVKSVSIPSSGQRLGAPGSPSASTVSHSSIYITWAVVDGADYYQLQSKIGDGNYSSPMRVEKPADASATMASFEHTGLSPSTKYTYQVRAVNINGPGDWSAAKSATTRPTTSISGQMPKVSGLVVTDASTYGTTDTLKIKLTWTAVGGVTHYDVQRYDPATAAGWETLGVTATGIATVGTATRITKDAAGSPPTLNDTANALSRGGTFYYVVSAVDDGPDDDTSTDDDEMGEWSDYMSVTLKDHKPGVPTALAATPTTATSLWVSWTAEATDRSATPAIGASTSFGLEWREEGTDARWTYVLVSGGATHHSLTGLRANMKYFIRVRAENSGGESDWVSLTDPVVLGSVLRPPTGLKAVDASTGGPLATTASDDVYRIKLSWTAVAGATGYEVQRLHGSTWGTPDETSTSDNVEQSGTSFTDDNDIDGDADSTGDLAPSATYLYRVRTVDRTFKSGWSPVVRGMTRPAAVDDSPILATTATGMSMIRVSWQAIAGATGYELEMIEGDRSAATHDWNAGIGQTKRTVAGTASHYVHRGLKAGTVYTYRLRAVLAEGVYSAWSKTATTDTDPTPSTQYTKPAKPELTTSNATVSSITLKWNAVSWGSGHLETDDGSNYLIQRREHGTSAWTTLTFTGTICTAATNKCEFVDGDADPAATGALTKSTRYYYRIRAVSSATDGSLTSYWDYANQTTPAN